MTSSPDLQTLLRGLPKIQLHTHIEGAVRAETYVALATKYGVALPAHNEPRELYAVRDVASFFDLFGRVSELLRHRDDFRQITYEALEDAASGGVRYAEVFVSAASHLRRGLRFEDLMDGIAAGAADAEVDFGVRARLIATLSRSRTPEEAVDLVEKMIARRDPLMIGLGLDGDEAKAPPEKFRRAFRLAGEAGFRRTAHVCERVSPTSEIESCLDVLGCDRLDHGYRILSDPALMRRCAARGVPFTVVPVAQSYLMKWYPELDDGFPIRRMADGGLRVILDNDDAAIAGVDPVTPYRMAIEEMGFSLGDVKRFILDSIEGSWLDEPTKRAWRRSWEEEIDAALDDHARRTRKETAPMEEVSDGG